MKFDELEVQIFNCSENRLRYQRSKLYIVFVTFDRSGVTATVLHVGVNGVGTLMYGCNRMGTPVCGEVSDRFSCMKTLRTTHDVL
jgi:hypothetical protein